MELRDLNNVLRVDPDETVGLISANREHDANTCESYFQGYEMIPKDTVTRTRCPASRRLLSQSAHFPDFANSNCSKDSPFAGLNMIHTSSANWPPSRKREEAKALENLRKRVEQSKLCKANRISDPGGSASTSTALKPNNVEQLDNRPKLLKKILSNRPMSIAHDSSDLETDWRDSEFITECLCWHNVYRQRHNAPPLSMSPQLCEYAQTWANHLAHTNAFYYRNDREVGQNLYCRPGGAISGDVTGQDVASYWYSAVRQYDFLKEPDILHANVNAGHFTQLIWAGSRLFGVGKARSRSGKIIVVANYQPVGNVSGHFQSNVLPPGPENANFNANLSPMVFTPPSPRILREQYEPSMSDASLDDSDNSSASSAQ